MGKKVLYLIIRDDNFDGVDEDDTFDAYDWDSIGKVGKVSYCDNGDVYIDSDDEVYFKNHDFYIHKTRCIPLKAVKKS